jgi:predicted AlkP superfamily pyrophosphatase or phosphodiesterase
MTVFAMTALLLATHQASIVTPKPSFDHVIVISVDGLRPDAIDGPEDGALPGFGRLLRGPHTFQARTDADSTVTLPNHVSMVTSRPVAGPAGHAWTDNGDPPAARHGGTLCKKNGAYVTSMFDVAHDRGLATAIIATKNKFSLLSQSFDETEGALDQEGSDDGKDKVDLFATARTSRMARDMAAGWLAAHPKRSLLFLHFAAPDAAGHGSGWDMATGSRYRLAIKEVDEELLALVALIEGDPALRGRVAIVLTADHGGGVPLKSHTDAKAAVNFNVPFIIWLGADTSPSELVALNSDRRAVLPASEHIGTDAVIQPIRSAESGNVALQLLGLPPVPGSVFNAKQDLQFTSVEPGPLRQ